MIVAFYILMAMVAVGALLYVHHRLDTGGDDHRTENDVPAPKMSEPDSQQQEVCCGMHITCEKDSLLASVSDTIEYYDDEELDRYRGRASDSYTGEEIEEWRDVLLTLIPSDIAGWGRSIQLRGLEMPDEVREELLLIVSEAREKTGKAI